MLVFSLVLYLSAQGTSLNEIIPRDHKFYENLAMQIEELCLNLMYFS